MTAYNPPLYAFPNLNFNPAIYEQGATYTLSSSSSNLTTNNIWTGTNTFSNLAGIATNVVDAITATTLSIGTSVANAISIGKSTFMTTVLGNFTVNGTTTLTGASTAPTVTYPSNTTNIATTAYVTSAVAGGSSALLSSNNTWTGTNAFNAGISLGSLQTITCGSVANDSTVMNTITNSSSNQTVTLSRVGQSYYLYRSTNSPNIPNITNTVLLSTTVVNAGIYTVSYHARYSASDTTTRGQGVQTWIYVSSPATYGAGGVGQLALNLVGYASPYLELQNVGVAMTSSWTGLINANASVQLITYIQYSGTTNGFMFGSAACNYLSITRIA